MMSPAERYAVISSGIDEILGASNDPATTARLLARAAILAVAALQGHRRAAALAYSLADELSTLKDDPKSV